MSLMNTKIKPFKNTAFKDGEFIEITEKSIKDQWSIFFFYPADFTFVCPTELEDLTNFYPKFKTINVEIYSVSTDTHFTHKAWYNTSNIISKIKYTMVSDPSGVLTRNFGIMREDQGLAERGTFLINPMGLIQLIEINAEGVGRNASELFRKVKATQYVALHPNEVCPAKWTEGERTLIPSIDLVGKI